VLIGRSQVVWIEGGDNRDEGDDSQRRACTGYASEVHTDKSLYCSLCSVRDIPGTKIPAHSHESPPPYAKT